MSKIYEFSGGGQRVRQLIVAGQSLTYKVDKDSDLPKLANVNGQSDFTDMIWNVDFETFKREIEEWAGQSVDLIEEEEYNSKQEIADERRDELISFLSERRSISISAFARECHISHSLLKFLIARDRNMTPETWQKIEPVMCRYGYRGEPSN